MFADKKAGNATNGSDSANAIKPYEISIKNAIAKNSNNESLKNDAKAERQAFEQKKSASGFTKLRDYIQTRDDEDYRNGVYSTTKYLNTPDEDTKAIQTILNTLSFKDRFGKELKEDGLWGAKTQWAWDTMQGQKEKSLEKMPDDKYSLELLNSNFEHNNIDVYQPDEYMKTVFDSNDDLDDSYYKTLSLLPKKSKNLLSDVWNETKWAFETIGNYANEAQKAAQRKFWKTGANVLLRNYWGCETSAWLLEHSLHDNPDDVYRGNNSRIAYLVNTSEEYLSSLDAKIKNNRSGIIDDDIEVIFGSDNKDLYYSLHRITIHIDGYLKNGTWNIHAKFSDKYDYTEFMTLMDDAGFSFDGSFGTVVNDMANVSQKTKAINPYNITVEFFTTYDMRRRSR